MSEPITLSSRTLQVRVSPRGAELKSVRDRKGREWLWQGDPRSWPRQAPVLFPVIGRCRNGVVRYQGRSYPMTIHGFAPNAVFQVQAQSAEMCVLRLVADENTRATLPFSFQLDVRFELRGETLTQEATVTNLGVEDLPSSVGFHPGFSWPLPSSLGVPRNSHLVRFQSVELNPIRRLSDQGLLAGSEQTSIVGRDLRLSDELFADGALVFERVESRQLWFGAPDREGILVDLGNMPHLGIWTLPTARFVCIEPWQGHSEPEGHNGNLLEKPGMVHLRPGEAYMRTIQLSFMRHVQF
jgi:galactose mutarotase-like enzyme